MGNQVNAIAVGAVGGGLIFLWSGLKGASVISSLQDLIKGQKPSFAQTHGIDAGGTSGPSGGGSGFTGTGTPGSIPNADWDTAKKWGGSYGVDPLLLVAIGFHETHWGTLGDGRNGNVLGVGSFDSGSSYKWAGVDNQLHEGAKILSQHGVHTIADVRAGKAAWWATDPSWKNGVSTWYDQLKGGK
jgi:hypothetical protein